MKKNRQKKSPIKENKKVNKPRVNPKKASKKNFIHNPKTLDKKTSNQLEKYIINADKVYGTVSIIRKPEEFVPLYNIDIPSVEKGTLIVLDQIKDKLITEMNLTVSELLDPKKIVEIKKQFTL